MTRLCLLCCLLFASLPLHAQQNPAGLALPGTAQVVDRQTPLTPDAVHLTGGMLGARVTANERNRLLHVDENDMLDAFERREAPHQDWQGEHVGKFLHAATLAWQNTGDPALKAKLDRVVARLLATQEPDGYLGTYRPDHRWTSWDVWVHKYDLLGLLTYYQYTRNAAALLACRRIGDLLDRTFGPGKRDINRAGEHMGMAADSVLEGVVLLYRATREPRYLRFARYIVSNYDAPGGPAIVASLARYGSVRRVANAKAYEMLSNFNGLLELYRVTGDRTLLNAMLTGWQDVVRNRLYLTGSASSYEVFQDDFHLPNGMRSNICETCVTVTWEQLNLQLLRLTGDPKFADQLERSIYNHLLAAQKPTGDDWAYYTPLEGLKPYDAATTCCHSSGPRGVALIPEIAAMADRDGGLAINLYNAGTVTAPLRSGRVTLEMRTDYPRTGHIEIRVTSARNGARFPLRLRIPAWTHEPTVTVNRRSAADGHPVPGTYFDIDRAWRTGDTVQLDLTLPTHLVPGDHENAGKAAVTYGPLVLALDAARNPGVPRLARVELAAAVPGDFSLAPPQGRPETGLTFTTRGYIESARRDSARTTGVQTKEIETREVETKEVKTIEVKMKEAQTVGVKDSVVLTLTPYADAGGDSKSRFEVWIPLPGQSTALTAASVFSGGKTSASRQGNVTGDIADDDLDTYSVTYDGHSAQEDWYAVALRAPIRIDHVIYAHGHTFHDGGWFDSTAGKPRIQVQTGPGGLWRTVATLESYPATTATNSAGLREGQKFEVKFAPVAATAIRIVGKPACGDRPEQAFSSCAELQAFATK